ncbi:hypothetical protein [Pseudarthrobacter cellobiosi]|uniref:hypothetical protein n=1 Tax=Pseudarthrobacter cellobiosi TaxID=2953654 RepID=UPI0035AC16B5
MDSRPAVETAEALSGSFAELAVVIGGTADSSGSCGPDPLRRRADIALETLAGVARGEAKMAALKVYAAAVYADAAEALAGPAESPQDHRGHGLALRLPPRRPGRRDLGTHHHRRKSAPRTS